MKNSIKNLDANSLELVAGGTSIAVDYTMCKFIGKNSDGTISPAAFTEADTILTKDSAIALCCHTAYGRVAHIQYMGYTDMYGNWEECPKFKNVTIEKSGDL